MPIDSKAIPWQPTSALNRVASPQQGIKAQRPLGCIWWPSVCIHFFLAQGPCPLGANICCEGVCTHIIGSMGIGLGDLSGGHRCQNIFIAPKPLALSSRHRL